MPSHGAMQTHLFIWMMSSVKELLRLGVTTIALVSYNGTCVRYMYMIYLYEVKQTVST